MVSKWKDNQNSGSVISTLDPSILEMPSGGHRILGGVGRRFGRPAPGPGRAYGPLEAPWRYSAGIAQSPPNTYIPYIPKS